MPKHVEIEFYHVIGGIVIRYGYIDALVGTICQTLFVDLGGHSSQKQAPRPMSKRLEYVLKCFRNKPELGALKTMAENICATIEQVDLHRTYIVHGSMTEYTPHETNPSFQFTKVDPKDTKDGYDQTSITFFREELAHVAQTCTEVVRGLT